jgi:hypothetical protein
MNKGKILKGVDSEIASLPPKEKKRFEEAYKSAVSDDMWLSQRGMADRTDEQVVKKILYNEMFHKDYSVLHTKESRRN